MDNKMFILTRLSEAMDLCIRAFDKNTFIEKFRIGLTVETDPVIQSAYLAKQLFDLCCATPVIQPDTPEIIYGVFEADNLIYVVGPANIGGLKAWKLEEYFASRNIFSGELSAPLFDSHKFHAAILTYYTVVADSAALEIEWCPPLNTPPSLGSRAIDFHQKVHEFNKQEINRPSYAVERETLRAVQEGNVQLLDSRSVSQLLNNMGYFSDNALKQLEYSACIILSLAARAAMMGGVNPELALHVQEIGMQHLAKCKVKSEISVLCSRALHGLAEMVAKHNKNNSRSNYIENAKTLVISNLSNPFTLEQAAAEIGINPQYLSRLFKKAVGVGFKQYTQTMRLEAAANMLRFTDASLSSIADTFCYNSQSHFCKAFKEKFGITPNEFRNNSAHDIPLNIPTPTTRT